MGATEKRCDRFSKEPQGTQPSSLTTPRPSTEALTVTGRLDAARTLRDVYRRAGGPGVFGVVASMPEEDQSRDIGNEYDRLMYLTLTVAIDYQRDALALWRHARERFDDPDTRWLFRPHEVAARAAADVLAALRRGNPRGALRYPPKDAAWWHQNATTLAREYDGDPRVLFQRAEWDLVRIRREVSHPGRFQGLKGPKIFPLWIRMLVDLLGYRFGGYEALPIPVDVHVARATFTMGVVRGRYDGPFDANLIDMIRRAWTDTCRASGESLMSFDAPLWQLSRLGCTHRHEGGSADCPLRAACPIGTQCPTGLIELSTSGARIAT